MPPDQKTARVCVRALHEAGQILCWAGDDLFERGSRVSPIDLIGLKVQGIQRQRIDSGGSAVGAVLELGLDEIRALVDHLLHPATAPVPAWCARYAASRSVAENEDGVLVQLDPPRCFEGVVTCVHHLGEVFLTRFWLEPLAKTDGAVDFGAEAT